MSEGLEVTVGQRQADFVGRDHLVLQAAVDYVSQSGGGTVRVLPGTYYMGNSLFLRSNLRIVGAGDKTVLVKNPSDSTRLTEDLDWYGYHVTVKNPGLFAVGGGILLRGKCPHYERKQYVKRTVLGIEGNVLTLDRQPRENFWIDASAEAATLYPVVTGDNVQDITLESLTLDGNREQNEHLDGNYSGCVFLQDCPRVTLRDVTAMNNNGDGLSWQICNDVTVDNCRCLYNADLGLHPGSGSLRPIMTNNTLVGNGIGIFFCWGVKDGVAGGNTIEDSRQFGISIGHRDTDNLIAANTIRRSGVHGVLFREHPVAARDPHRNVLEENLIEDSGHGAECVAIEMKGACEDVVLRGNRLVDTRRKSSRRQRIGLRVREKVTRLVLDRNTYSGFEQDILDLRLGRRRK